MNETKYCPKCGAELSEDAPQGLCPKCLMANVLGSDGPSKSEASTIDQDPNATVPSEVYVGSLIGDIPAAPEPVGKYSILGEHGKGGMGRVLLVHDEHLGRDIALKELLPDLGDGSTPTPARHSKEMAARFLREAKITGQLEHPSITPVHEIGRKADGTLYYTMKLVRGRTLSQAIKSAKNFEARLKLLPHFVDLCNAIAYAHSRGVIHRDIKPSNVMIGDYGETVIIDWGLAKRTGEACSEEASRREARPSDGHGDGSIRTLDGHALGTPSYMAPEQALGQGDRVGTHSDVYSLGAVLFELVTGAPPVDGKNAEEVARRVIAGDLRSAETLEPSCPKSMVDIIERAMALEPAGRYTDAMALGRAVESWKPPVSRSRAWRITRNTTLAIAAVLVLVTIGLDRYYSNLVDETHESILALGGTLHIRDYKSPREAESNVATTSNGGFSVPGFLVSMDTVYPGLETIVEDASDLSELAASPRDISKSQRDRIEAILDHARDILNRTTLAASHPPASSVDIVRAMQMDTQSPGNILRPNYNVCLDVADLIKLRAALHWQDGNYDEAVSDLEILAQLSLHLKDGPGLISLVVGSKVANRSIADLAIWFQQGAPSPQRLRPYVGLLGTVASHRAATSALDGERCAGLWLWRTLDSGDLTPISQLTSTAGTLWMYRAISSLPLRWLRRREELAYLQPMAFGIQAYALPYTEGQVVLDQFLSEDDYLEPWLAPPFAHNLYITYLDEARYEARLDVTRVALAATLFRREHGGDPEGLSALTPDILTTTTVDVFSGRPLQYVKRHDDIQVYSVGPNGVDDGGTLDDITWRPQES